MQDRHVISKLFECIGALKVSPYVLSWTAGALTARRAWALDLSWFSQQQWLQPAALQLLQHQQLLWLQQQEACFIQQTGSKQQGLQHLQRPPCSSHIVQLPYLLHQWQQHHQQYLTPCWYAPPPFVARCTAQQQQQHNLWNCRSFTSTASTHGSSSSPQSAAAAATTVPVQLSSSISKLQHQAGQQQQQHSSPAAVAMRPVLQAVNQARQAGQTAAVHALLQKALIQLTADVQCMSLDTIGTVLYSCAASGLAVPQPQLLQLLQHLGHNSALCSLKNLYAAFRAVQESTGKQQQRQQQQQEVLAHLQPLQERLLQLLHEMSIDASSCSYQQIHMAVRAVKAVAAATARNQESDAAAAAATTVRDKWQLLLQPLLQQALKLRLPSVASLTAKDVNHLLWLHQAAGPVTLPQQDMEQLLLQACATADQYNLTAATNVLYAAHLSRLQLSEVPHQQLLQRALQQLLLQQQAPALFQHLTRVLQAFENAGVPAPQPQLLQLVDYVISNIGHCQPDHAARLIRSAAYADLQLQEDQLLQLLQRILLPQRRDKSNPLDERVRVPSPYIVQVLKAVSHMGQQIRQDVLEQMVHQLLSKAPPGGIPAAQASTVLKAVACMQQTLPKGLLKPLLRPLQQQTMQGQHMTYLPTVLAVIKQMVIEMSDAKLRPLLKMAKQALQLEATAAAGGAADAAEVAAGNSIMAASAHQQQRLSASQITDLLRSLAAYGEGVTASLLIPLTDAFLSKAPTAKDVALYVATVGNAKQAVTLSQVQSMLRQVQQPRQLAQLGAAEVGLLLWGLACMGYSLSSDVAQALVQQQLSHYRQPPVYSLVQTLWALANMGPAAETEQPQALPAALMQQLLQKLHQVALQELGLWPARESSRSGNSSSHCTATRLTSTSDVAHGGGSDVCSSSSPANNSSSSGQTHPMYWQLSLAAWAAAICNAESCKEEVLQLCSILAEPGAWQHLRLIELVQLSLVHIWWNGYRWSDTGGLAACFSQQQLQQIKAARQHQVAAHAAWGASEDDDDDDVMLFPDEQQGQPPEAVRKNSSSSLAGTSSNGINAALQQQQQMLPQPAIKRPNPAGPSVSQTALFEVINSLPDIASASLEGITTDGLYAVDVAAKTMAGQNLAVEFDGPFHYAMQVRDAAEAGGERQPAAVWAEAEAGSKQQQLSAAQLATLTSHSPPSIKINKADASALVRSRTTMFRDRVLEAYGYAVVSVPYYTWADRGTVAVQQHQVQQMIKAVLLKNTAKQGNVW